LTRIHNVLSHAIQVVIVVDFQTRYINFALPLTLFSFSNPRLDTIRVAFSGFRALVSHIVVLNESVRVIIIAVVDLESIIRAHTGADLDLAFVLNYLARGYGAEVVVHAV